MLAAPSVPRCLHNTFGLKKFSLLNGHKKISRNLYLSGDSFVQSLDFCDFWHFQASKYILFSYGTIPNHPSPPCPTPRKGHICFALCYLITLSIENLIKNHIISFIFVHTINSKLYFLKKLPVFSYYIFDALATVSGLFSNASQPNAPKTITLFPPAIATSNILDILFT